MSINEPDWNPVILRKNRIIKSNNMNSSELPLVKIVVPKSIKDLNKDDPSFPKVLGIENGKIIQKARVELKLSQKDLAKKISEKDTVIRDYENGSVVPDRKILNKLNKILNTNTKLKLK